jgi:hypothetical protein
VTFDGDGHGDLVLGAPYENVAGIADVGTGTGLYGALFADGAESGQHQLVVAERPRRSPQQDPGVERGNSAAREQVPACRWTW